MPHSDNCVEAQYFHNLLTDDGIIRVSTTGGRAITCSLPRLYALLMADEVACLSALRPHQKQALHCFLVQTGAMALLAAGEREPPRDSEPWAQLLRRLSPNMRRDEPWCLVVEDLAKPAFMQPPVPEVSWAPLNKRETTPDALDVLVTSKNHDLKAARIEDARPEHWLFALIILQTCEGFLGRGNYGISRMNGGFASRPFVGASPAEGGWGAHVRRDIRALVTGRKRILESDALHAPEDGIKLLWLVPWDGREAIAPNRLDPYYVEICRRVRLRQEAGSVVAMRGSSSAMRVNQPKIKYGGKEHTLPTGDPWTPVEVAGTKPLTVDGSGFTYRRIVNLLDEGKFTRAPLQQLDERESKSAMQLVFIATVRGQGETQGYHERRILIPPRAVPFFMRNTASPRLATLARQRVQDVSDVSFRMLRPALFTLFQSAPEKINYADPKAKGKADIFVTAFDRSVDEDFFDRLFEELVEAPESAAARIQRRTWIELLATRARAVLGTAEAGSPLSHVRRYRSRAAAERVLEGAIRNHFRDVFNEAA
jgi:CRISPR system Cascade subunit CasA